MWPTCVAQTDPPRYPSCFALCSALPHPPARLLWLAFMPWQVTTMNGNVYSFATSAPYHPLKTWTSQVCVHVRVPARPRVCA